MITKIRNSSSVTLAWPIIRELKLYERQGPKHSSTMKISQHRGHSGLRKNQQKNLRNTLTQILERNLSTKDFIFLANKALLVQKKRTFMAKKAEMMILAKLE